MSRAKISLCKLKVISANFSAAQITDVLLRHPTVENLLEKFTFILRYSNLYSIKEYCVFTPCLNANSALARFPTLRGRVIAIQL